MVHNDRYGTRMAGRLKCIEVDQSEPFVYQYDEGCQVDDDDLHNCLNSLSGHIKKEAEQIEEQREKTVNLKEAFQKMHNETQIISQQFVIEDSNNNISNSFNSEPNAPTNTLDN